MLKRSNKADEPIRQKPIRLWPGIVIVVLQWLIRFGLPAVLPDFLDIGVLGGVFLGLAIVIWWAFFSRASWIERLGAAILMVISLIATRSLLHESISTAGQGMLYPINAIPLLSLAFVIWAVAGRRLSGPIRQISMVLTILIACGGWMLVRSDGITADAGMVLKWRWSATAEEKLLAQTVDQPLLTASLPVATEADAEWPGFRGPGRNSIVQGAQINTDWSTSPPVELWRRKIGPGCSSFAVRGNYFYTQEQRGDDEIVACYNLSTGDPVWQHRDAARFWDSHAGAGPRATPTLSDSCVFTFGATGILNVLDARNGSVIWSRNPASDTDAKDSGWGFTSSPLVVKDVVIVAATGKLAAYDRVSGEPRWFGPDGGDSYSSPHLMTIGGVTQIVLLSGSGAAAFAPADGTQLWVHSWEDGTRIVQPALADDGDLLISAGAGKGMRRIAAVSGSDGWHIEERWTSTRLRPDFNDFVVHKGYIYGFDGGRVTCIDASNGERKWKGENYGGQLLLLADQDLLLVLSEKGELVLVRATSEKFDELANYPAIAGKTWNHPVMAGNILLVRNTEEMAAFRLASAGR